MIINMADKMKDAEDLKLEALFKSESIADAGFSTRIEKRMRRQLLINRFALPVAILIGGLIAFKPMIDLLSAFSHWLVISPEAVSKYVSLLVTPNLSSMPLVWLGGLIVLGFVMFPRMLED